MSFPRLSAAGRAYRLGVYLICALLATAPATADTLIVGPKAGELSLADAVKRAQDGDTIAILEGEYDAQVAVIEHKKLTLKGVGKRPVLRAGGRVAEGKAILVIRGEDITVENLEFRGARAPDGNGAGIRFERGRLLVKDCAFLDNENGLLTGNVEDAELTIADSLFAEAPRTEGSLPHLLYAGRIGKLSVTGSRFHEGYEGHLIKSRAKQTLLSYNLIADGWAGEASYEVDLPNGGLAVLVGNTIGQGPRAQNRVLVAFGAEGNGWPENKLYLAHNTLVSNGWQPAWFLRLFKDRLPPGAQAWVVNNVAAGVGVFSMGADAVFEGNGRTLGRWLREQTLMDFSLPADSWLRGTAVDARRIDGRDLTPKAEFKLPIGARPITPPASWSPGAFQQ
ncbi:MAG: hypothetical protein KA020_14190 [Planctomycetes bacterium]|nr:hypothetical protein [Planctomycetota bacterium]